MLHRVQYVFDGNVLGQCEWKAKPLECRTEAAGGIGVGHAEGYAELRLDGHADRNAFAVQQLVTACGFHGMPHRVTEIQHGAASSFAFVGRHDRCLNRNASLETNASRTMLFDIHRQDWDDELLTLFDVPRAMLPEVRDSSADFGATEPDLIGAAVPITGIAGDQQAAAFGQACHAPGMIKSTYGTGCFALLNTGETAVASRNRLLTTVGYRLGGRPAYALEGSIFVAGAAIKWLRDRLGLIDHAGETAAMAAQGGGGGVFLVPAFVGLGAPYWDADARGAIVGMTLDTGRDDIVRAALEAVAYQTRDLMDAMTADGAVTPVAVRVDGGMAVNDWAMQFLADMLGTPVERPTVTETTALGAAYLAGLHTGFFDGLAAIAGQWRRDRLFEPAMGADERETRYAGWRAAVARVRSA